MTQFVNDNELEILKKEVAELKHRLDTLTKELCPNAPKTDAEIYAEVENLVLTLGPDKAAEEINRRNRLREVI